MASPWAERKGTQQRGASRHEIPSTSVVFFLSLFSVFETGSDYVALAALELIMWTRLVSNSQRLAYLCLPLLVLKVYTTVLA